VVFISDKIISVNMKEGALLSPLTLDDVRELYDSKTDTCRPIQVVALTEIDPGDKSPIVLSTSCDGIHVRFWHGNTEESTFLPYITLNFNGALGEYVPSMFGRPNSYSEIKGWLGQKDAKAPPKQWNFLMSKTHPGWPEAFFLDGTCIYHREDWGLCSMRRFYVVRWQ